MYHQAPMPPRNTRGYYYQHSHYPLRQHPVYRNHQPMLGSGHFGSFTPRRSGGLKELISKIMPGGQQHNWPITGSHDAMRNPLQSFANPTNISTVLGNVQKVLGMAQQVTPMVQQYGPLIKNLPAMIKIYSELKNSDGNEPSMDNQNDESKSTNPTKSKPMKKHKMDFEINDEQLSNTSPFLAKRSKPRLYI